MNKFIALLIILLVSAGCTQAAPPPTVSAPGSGQPPAIKFVADPSTIMSGESTKLKWEITNAATASIDQGIGPVVLTGDVTVAPKDTTTYTLTASNKNGTASANAQVIIRGALPAPPPETYNLPVVAVLKVEPANITAGQTAILSWEVQNSFDVSISPGLSIITPKGSKEVSPSFTTTYKLTTTNSQGTIIATTTVTVSGTQPNEETPVISFLNAIPYVVKRGQPATLSWKSAGGSSASIDKGVGIVDGSGTKSVTPSETTTYMLTVTNPRGAQFQTVTVNVR